MKILDDLRKEIPSRIPEPRISHKEILQEEHSMRYKHSDLLTVTRELILPVHYKHLLELSKYLDNSLIFLKQRRTQGGLFLDIKKSIEQTYGK
jgi:hypothetical protein